MRSARGVFKATRAVALSRRAPLARALATGNPAAYADKLMEVSVTPHFPEDPSSLGDLGEDFFLTKRECLLMRSPTVKL